LDSKFVVIWKASDEKEVIQVGGCIMLRDALPPALAVTLLVSTAKAQTRKWCSPSAVYIPDSAEASGRAYYEKHIKGHNPPSPAEKARHDAHARVLRGMIFMMFEESQRKRIESEAGSKAGLP
jgi:hypothetical protein